MNEEEFKQHILSCYVHMKALALRMLGGDSSAAADAVQDTIVALWEKRSAIRTDPGIRALCLTAIRNRCITILRNEGRMSSLSEITDRNIPRQEQPSDVSHVYRAIASLPDNQNRAVTLNMQGFTTGEIAVELGVSEPNARQLLSRGRRALRKKIAEHYD